MNQPFGLSLAVANACKRNVRTVAKLIPARRAPITVQPEACPIPANALRSKDI